MMMMMMMMMILLRCGATSGLEGTIFIAKHVWKYSPFLHGAPEPSSQDGEPNGGVGRFERELKRSWDADF